MAVYPAPYIGYKYLTLPASAHAALQIGFSSVHMATWEHGHAATGLRIYSPSLSMEQAKALIPLYKAGRIHPLTPREEGRCKLA